MTRPYGAFSFYSSTAGTCQYGPPLVLARVVTDPAAGALTATDICIPAGTVYTLLLVLLQAEWLDYAPVATHARASRLEPDRRDSYDPDATHIKTL